jgi:hypothetical protein
MFHCGSSMLTYCVTVRPSALTRYNGPRMSLTKRFRESGSGTRSIMRAATPSMSGSVANSRMSTRMTSSAARMDAG